MLRTPKRLFASSVKVGNFRDINTLLKQFIKRVHPDVMHRHPDKCRAVNQASLQDLHNLFTALEARCTLNEKSISKLPTIGDSYPLQFFAVTQTDALNAFSCTLAIPSSLEMQTQMLCKRDRGAQQAPLWLEYAVQVLSTLFRHAGIDTKIEPPVRSAKQPGATDPSNSATAQDINLSHIKPPPRSFVFQSRTDESPEAALKHNLLQYSPLVQGKSDAFPEYGFRRGSIFAKQMRENVIGNLFRNRNVEFHSTVSPRERTVCSKRLARLLVDYFDAVHGYHAIYHGALQFIVGPAAVSTVRAASTPTDPPHGPWTTPAAASPAVAAAPKLKDPYHINARKATVYMPVDFDDRTLVLLLQKGLPDVITQATAAASLRQHASPPTAGSIAGLLRSRAAKPT